MYKLSDLMLQNLESNLRKYHELFQGGRCDSWQMEELVAKAIRSDFDKTEGVRWKGNGHDIGCDIMVNGNIEIQMKSGKVNGDRLTISGHRLGTFDGDMQGITDFLNTRKYTIIATPYKKTQDEMGRAHNYELWYIDSSLLHLEHAGLWQPTSSGKAFTATNRHGVKMRITPSMSWQIWWDIPVSLVPGQNRTRVIRIG